MKMENNEGLHAQYMHVSGTCEGLNEQYMYVSGTCEGLHAQYMHVSGTMKDYMHSTCIFLAHVKE